MELTEIIEIIKCNPNKENISYGVELNERLDKCISGENLDDFFKRNEYFETKEIHKERKKTTSNKDLIGRILQKEEMVFNARGGSCIYEGITEDQQKKINITIDNLRMGMNLRSWIKEFANRAYEIDPMGVCFIEKDSTGNPYPTYKSIKSVYDYHSNGQSLDYVCFTLTNKEADDFEVPDVEFEKLKPNDQSKYFRFVDETSDYIFKKENNVISLVELKEDGKKMTFDHKFGKCPGIIFSDIPYIKNTQRFVSKLDKIIELAEVYQYDRSVRDLTKKFHGFPKHYEPAMKCPKCTDGYIGGVICQDCNGTGRKKITSVSDTIVIPLEMLVENSSMNVANIFGYVTPPITTWDKQDDSLSDLENLMMDCYWGTDNRKFSKGANLGTTLQETATKTMTNLQPVYARLERTAEWAEKFENKVVDFVGIALFGEKFKATIKYGHDYILESTDQIYVQYLEYKLKGSPQYILNDYLERYLRSNYQNNPIELAVALKMMEVEPFIHYTAVECLALNLDDQTMKEKVFFPEWYSSLGNDILFSKDVSTLKGLLTTFATTKVLKAVTPVSNPLVKDIGIKVLNNGQ